MVRFYGLSVSEIRNLDAQTAQDLWLAITKLEARELQNQILVSSYPNMKPEEKKRVVRSLEQQTKSGENVSRPMSNSELDLWLRSSLG